MAKPNFILLFQFHKDHENLLSQVQIQILGKFYSVFVVKPAALNNRQPEPSATR